MEQILEFVHNTESPLLNYNSEAELAAECIILELKVGYTAEEAVEQIKEKQYALRFLSRLGEKRKYTGRILTVGIAYNRETKKHHCLLEEIIIE